MKKHFTSILLLLSILLYGQTITNAETSNNAYANKASSDTIIISRDEVTGALLEQSVPTNTSRSLAATETPIHLNRLEDAFPHAKIAVNQFAEKTAFAYTVNKGTNFDYNAHLEEIKSLMKPLFNDGSYSSGTLKQTGYSIRYWQGVNSTEVELFVTFSYYHTAQQEQALTMQVKEIADTISKHATTDLDKVLAVNDFITRTYAYSDRTRLTPHSAYTIVTEGMGVCQAYALVAQRLLEELDMDVYYQTGKIHGGELHAWNLVLVDGSWYNFDPTWNDPVSDRIGQSSVKYLLVSDSVISQSRSIDDLGLPAAQSTKYDVLHPSNNYATYAAYDDENIYSSQWGSSSTGQLITAYNKNTMKSVQNIDLTDGRFLVSHEGDIYHFGVYQQTNLYVWNRDENTVHKIKDGTFDELYKIDNTLYYRDANTKKVHSFALENKVVVPEPSDNEVSAALVTAKIAAISEDSSTFKEDVHEADQAYEALVADAKKLVTNYNVLINYNYQINQQASVHLVIDLINELDEYAANFEQALAIAKTQYEGLTTDNKLLVTNREQLEKMQKLLLNQDILKTTFKHYKQWTPLTSNDIMKPWTVTFNAEIAPSLNAPLAVFDRFGREVEDVEIIIDGNKIHLQPETPYRTGHMYSIVINDALQNTNQLILKQGVLATFIITE